MAAAAPARQSRSGRSRAGAGARSRSLRAVVATWIVLVAYLTQVAQGRLAYYRPFVFQGMSPSSCIRSNPRPSAAPTCVVKLVPVPRPSRVSACAAQRAADGRRAAPERPSRRQGGRRRESARGVVLRRRGGTRCRDPLHGQGDGLDDALTGGWRSARCQRLPPLTLNAQHTQRVQANANAAFVITLVTRPSTRVISSTSRRSAAGRTPPGRAEPPTLTRRSGVRTRPIWWSQPGSNRRPSGCQPDALPAELWPQGPTL